MTHPRQHPPAAAPTVDIAGRAFTLDEFAVLLTAWAADHPAAGRARAGIRGDAGRLGLLPTLPAGWHEPYLHLIDG